MRKLLNSIGLFLSTTRGKVATAASLTLAIVAAPVAAFAQTTPTPYGASNAQSDVTGFADTTFTAVAPMIIALAGAVIGVILLVWGVRLVLHKVRGVRI